ncbi:hypothetical protein [Cerasicoccus frondis]|uniref:hypothetical protein n=1 Tax=Cerasicoccus frondis TaxID=490090 RepID=UPI002852D3EB|nr:hypothetical protein [Cerasicoccus frondis]
MNNAEETPGPEPEDLSAEELDRQAYLNYLPPSYRLDGENCYNPFPAFDPEEPDNTFWDEIRPLCRTPPIPEGLYQHRNLDPLGLLKDGMSADDGKVHKLKFCEAGSDLLRGIIHAFAVLAKDSDPDIRSRAKEQLAYAARATAQDLSADKADLNTMHDLAAAFTGQLDASSRHHKDSAKEIAEKNHQWPVMLSHRKYQQKRVGEYVDDLKLASKHKAEVVDFDTEINAYTSKLVDYVDRLRRVEVLERPNSRIRIEPLMPVPDDLFKRVQELTPLEASNGDEWFKVVWDVLLHFTDGQPETYEMPERLGEYQVEVAKGYAVRPRSYQQDERSTRSGFRRRMRQSVLSIAKNL